MLKMSIEAERHALNGATMGTRWSALFYAAPGTDPAQVQAALQSAVTEIDMQMSTWDPQSDLMRLNRAPIEEWVEVPAHLFKVLSLGMEIGRRSGGAFDIAMGDAVTAWGFGPSDAEEKRIVMAMAAVREPAHDMVQLDSTRQRVRKCAPLSFDLNGIAKGYGVDRLGETLVSLGISSGLVGIDGEVRALGLRPDGHPWTIAVEAPERERRTPHSILDLHDGAVATSGDYRHWVTVQGRRLSHTMDPKRGAPLVASPASVTVIAKTCAEADAWATALMVLGADEGLRCARRYGLNALFLMHDENGGVASKGAGALFA